MRTGVPTSPRVVADAIERLREYFGERQTRQGVLARRCLSLPRPGDAQLTDHLVRERRAGTRMDGSVGGDLIRTAWTAFELIDLGHDHQSAGTVRLVGFLLSLHGKMPAGPELPETPLPTFRASEPGERITPLTFPNGCVLRRERDARLAASFFALRVVLRGGQEERRGIREHVAALRDWREFWTLGVGARPVDLAGFALAAMALAPLDLADRLDGQASVIADRQAADGTWPDADLFNVLEGLIAAGVPSAHEAVRRAVPPLLARQQPDGTFDPEGHEERALIGLRALLRAT